MTSEERIVELETRVAYQEDTIQALNKVLCKQQDQLDKLERSCVALAERLKEAVAAGQADAPDDEAPPPHY